MVMLMAVHAQGQSDRADGVRVSWIEDFRRTKMDVKEASNQTKVQTLTNDHTDRRWVLSKLLVDGGLEQRKS